MRHDLLRIGSALALSLAACAGAGVGVGPTSPRAEESREVRSNVLRSDYAGSASCEPCHAELVQRFARSPMHRMTRSAREGEIQAPFDGHAFPFKGYSVIPETVDDRRYVRVRTPTNNDILYRVTKVIGGRYREDFVGQEVRSTAANAEIVGDPEGEPILPISWLIFAKTWRYKGYSVMSTERPRIERGAAWKKTCIFCHNTEPFLATIYDDLGGGHTKGYQGSISDRLLPEARVLRFSVKDEPGLTRAMDDEVAFISGSSRASSVRIGAAISTAIDTTRERFGEKQLVELGIGCEACHNGAKEHVANPAKHPTMAPKSSLLEATTTEKVGPATWTNRACARCHTVLFSKYAWTWEGGTRKGQAGGSAINSGEARDFLLGGCANELTCTTCHDPHGEDSREKLDAMGTVQGNGLCTSCHAKYGGEGLAQHTHHAPAGEGSACLSCHMPRKNMGLAYKLTRYHRIGSPTDEARVTGDRPLECALCHVDKSVDELTRTMEGWWKKSFDRTKLRALYGDDLSVNVLQATIFRGKAHEQAAAASTLGERGRRGAAPLLVPVLASDYPLVRRYAKASIEKLEGAPMPLDLDGDVATFTASASEWLRARP